MNKKKLYDWAQAEFKRQREAMWEDKEIGDLVYHIDPYVNHMWGVFRMYVKERDKLEKKV